VFKCLKKILGLHFYVSKHTMEKHSFLGNDMWTPHLGKKQKSSISCSFLFPWPH
jgi:hypothetical protein